MSKTTNGLGQFSGKLGGIVYSVRNGQQIVRQYQPIVSNPKSQAQRLQRAKGNLVGQISQITPYQILEGLGTNKMERRSRFLRLCLKAATAAVDSTDPSIINSKLASEDFVFSEGALIPTISPVSAAAAVRAVNVTLQRLLGVSDADFNASGVLVVVTILSSDGQYESVLYKFIDADSFGNNDTLSISFQHVSEGNYEAVIYAAPFSTSDGTALRAVANKMFGDGADFSASMVYNPSALPLVWGASKQYIEVSYSGE